MADTYNPDKLFKTSGKVIDDKTPPPAEGAEPVRKDVIDTRTKPAEEKTPPADTPEVIEEKRIAAQATMTPEQILADNETAAEAKLTPEEKLVKENERKAAAELATAEKLKTDAEAEVLKKVLKELGVTSIDELKTKLPAKPETEEEKTAREQNLKVNVAQYAVKNKILSMDEITSMESMRKTDPAELARSVFAKEYKEVHKDRVDAERPGENVPVTEAEIDDAFNDFFHTNSDNAALKKSGEKSLQNYVKGIIGDTEQKYNDAVADYQEFEARKTFFPTWKGFMKEVVDNVPAELTWGEGENKVVLKTDKLDKTAIEKLYQTDEAYDAFYTNKGDQSIREKFRNEFNERLAAKNIGEIVKEAIQTGRTIGIKEGTEIGAKAPFDPNKTEGGQTRQSAKNDKTPQQNREELRKRYSNVHERG